MRSAKVTDSCVSGQHRLIVRLVREVLLRKSRISLGVLALALAVPAIPATAAPATATTDQATEVLLPTGDHVIVRTLANGASTASVLPGGAGIGHTYIALTLNGDRYEVPASAVPYLGNGLDLSLFDVTALAANKNTVPVTFSGGAVPGLTVTGAGTGYLNADGAKELGAALTKQYLADKAKAQKPALFGGVSLSAPGAKPQTTATPHFPMRTVTIAGDNADGKPDTGALVLLANVDDTARYAAPNEMFQGTAKFSVPDGHYFAAVVYFDTDADGNVTAEHDVFDSQLTVSGDQTIRLDAKKATSRLTMVTPRPSQNSGGAFYVARMDTAGHPALIQLSFGAGVPVWVSPQPTPVTVGTMYSYPQMWLTSPPAPGAPYVYDLQYLATGVIPAQRYVVRAKDLATLNTGFYSDYATSGLFDMVTVYPFEAQFGIGGELTVQQNMPASTTFYVPGDPTLGRNATSIKYTVPSGDSIWFYGMQHSSLSDYHAGQVVTENWNKFPLHTTAQANPGGAADKNAALVPGASRAGDTESFHLAPFSDNQPGHSGPGLWSDPRDTVSGSWQLDQDGTKIAGDQLSAGALAFDQRIPVSAVPSTLRLTLDANRTGPMYRLGTATHTEWTWRSTHQQGTTLPAPWQCSEQAAGDNCAVEPMMTVSYDVNNMDTTGTVPSDLTQGIDLTFGHLDLGSAITDAALQYSTDDGASWQNGSVSPSGNGKFHASFVVNATAPGEYVTLKVTAHDAAGGAITETLTRAYVLY